MISYIRGELAAVQEQKAIVEAGGIGYGIYMSQQTLSMLPAVGEEVKIHTDVYKRQVQFLMEGFVPSLYDSLGLYIPLIVVNCIILGRAESYASKNPVLPSIFDGIGMGLGFTVGLTAIGIVRELIGAGKILSLIHI